jgi:hypothetical protein
MARCATNEPSLVVLAGARGKVADLNKQIGGGRAIPKVSRPEVVEVLKVQETQRRMG